MEELIQEEIYDEFDHYTVPINSKALDVSLVSDYRKQILLNSVSHDFLPETVSNGALYLAKRFS